MSAIPNRVERGEYYISFGTKGTPGFIRAVKVTIEVDMLPDDALLPKHEQAKYRVDLAEHPLYKDLQAYVKGNPR